MNLKNILKNNNGQILLIVILTSTIALIMVTGIFLRVLRLNQRKIELESHESAFSSAETYVREIRDAILRGELINENWLSENIETNSDVLSTRIEPVTSIYDYSLESTYNLELESESDELSDYDLNMEINKDDFSNDGTIMVTRVLYTGGDNGSYEVRKGLCNNEGAYNGYKGVSDTLYTESIGCYLSVDELVVNYEFKNKTLADDSKVIFRITPVNTDIRFDISSNNGSVGNKYIVTTMEENALSEAQLIIAGSRSLPSIFDYAIFNNQGKIVK